MAYITVKDKKEPIKKSYINLTKQHRLYKLGFFVSVVLNVVLIGLLIKG